MLCEHKFVRQYFNKFVDNGITIAIKCEIIYALFVRVFTFCTQPAARTSFVVILAYRFLDVKSSVRIYIYIYIYALSLLTGPIKADFPADFYRFALSHAVELLLRLFLCAAERLCDLVTYSDRLR